MTIIDCCITFTVIARVEMTQQSSHTLNVILRKLPEKSKKKKNKKKEV